MRSIRICSYLVLLAAFTACSEEEPKQIILPENHPRSKFEEVTIREVHENGIPSEEVTAEKKFISNDGRLTEYIFTQSFYGGSINQTSQVTYSDYQANITDEFGNKSVYTLNEWGYAISCTRINEASGEQREYRFDYTEDKSENKFYLTEIKESINNKPFSQIQIVYGDLGHFLITLQVGDLIETYTATQSDNRLINNTSDLPNPFLCETYPLSLHEVAIYGKLLGDPYPVLITQLKPEGDMEITNYLYEQNEDNVITACTRKTTVYENSDGGTKAKTYSNRILYSFR